MWEFRNFVLGFSISLVSVSLTSHLLTSSSHIKKPYLNNSNISIELFKNTNTSPKVIFSNIQKSSLLSSTTRSASSSIEHIPNATEVQLANFTPSQDNIPDEDIVYSPSNIDGIEDDEILSINIDNTIPIDIENTHNLQNAEISNSNDNDNKVALLPTDLFSNEPDSDFDSPWIVAQGSKHIKNKKLLEKYTQDTSKAPVLDDFKQLADKDDNLSYKVAERIKQSIIFPIPDEILNDENLTPTFISQKPKASTKQAPSTKQKPKSEEQEVKPVKIISKTEPTAAATNKKQETSKGILDNISSWFSPSVPKKEKAIIAQKNKIAPSYSSQSEDQTQPTNTNSSSALSSNDALVSFYETIQETQKEQASNKIIPSELKLSFQPDRAEISGQTLRWLKAFSEKSRENNTYLQIRLDATAPIELQRKRLNLLYTIFMNNGVDFKKVDTVFSLTEPNTFIIRTIKVQE